jgi:hypothetical protein
MGGSIGMNVGGPPYRPEDVAPSLRKTWGERLRPLRPLGKLLAWAVAAMIVSIPVGAIWGHMVEIGRQEERKEAEQRAASKAPAAPVGLVCVCTSGSR